MAADAAGNVYFDEITGHTVKKWSLSNSNVATLVAPGSDRPAGPRGVAVDSSGNVYIDDTGYNTIVEWTAANSNEVTLWSAGLYSSSGVAVDAAGNVYFANSGYQTILKLAAANNSISTLASSGLSRSRKGVAADGGGNVYWANATGGSIMEWIAASAAVTTLRLLPQPQSAAVDAAGNVYFTDRTLNTVSELSYAFVDPTPKSEGMAAGNDALPAVLPATQNLLPPFAPTTDASWLTITGITNGVVYFSFAANASLSRTAHITLLGTQVPVVQTGITPPTLAGVQMLGKGVIAFSFTNTPNASFTILSSASLSLPLSNWTVVGKLTDSVPGQFQFTSPPTTNDASRFYRITSP